MLSNQYIVFYYPEQLLRMLPQAAQFSFDLLCMADVRGEESVTSRGRLNIHFGRLVRSKKLKTTKSKIIITKQEVISIGLY